MSLKPVPLCVSVWVCKRGHTTTDREGCFLSWNIGWAHNYLPLDKFSQEMRRLWLSVEAKQEQLPNRIC